MKTMYFTGNNSYIHSKSSASIFTIKLNHAEINYIQPNEKILSNEIFIQIIEIMNLKFKIDVKEITIQSVGM